MSNLAPKKGEGEVLVITQAKYGKTPQNAGLTLIFFLSSYGVLLLSVLYRPMEVRNMQMIRAPRPKSNRKV